jgi:hypothetical protein
MPFLESVNLALRVSRCLVHTPYFSLSRLGGTEQLELYFLRYCEPKHY